ncbi:MAG TPA: hypothetical protein VL327_13955 [Pyrinomonadaceae bacterium]|jgi:hypothetical protein|nr:hypothetical protein [Pyrinomonadaceae bacterium]
MKIFKNLIFTAVFLIGLSTAAMAQKDGPKRPPKNPPTINAPDKGNKPKENPKGNNDRGGKKPGLAVYFRESDNAIEVM